MSVALDAVDLSAATVNTVGPVDWTGIIQAGAPGGVRAGRPHLRVFNESGCGLRIVFTSGTSDRVPAGGWAIYQLSNDTRFTYTVEYVLPGAPVSLLLCTLYEPGEAVPPVPVLGNSPIGIGGTVSTTTGNSIKNDGNAPATSIVEATPSDQAASSVAVNNDASGFLKVLSANVLRTVWSVIRGNAGAGKAAVQFGDSGDPTITTFYGSLQGGQPGAVGTLAAGAITASAIEVINLTAPGSGNTDSLIIQRSGGFGTGETVFGLDSSGNLYAFDVTHSGFSFQASATSFQVGGTLQDKASGRVYHVSSFFGGTGTGTYNHNLGTSPAFIAVTPEELNSTQTMGIDTVTATTVHVNMPNAWPFVGMASV